MDIEAILHTYGQGDLNQVEEKVLDIIEQMSGSTDKILTDRLACKMNCFFTLSM